MTCWKKGKVKKGLPPSCERPLSLPAADSWLTDDKEWKGNNVWECIICCWTISHVLSVLDFFSFLLNVTLSQAEATPLLLGNAALCWLYRGTAEARLFPIVVLKLLQSSFKLPVTLLTISSSPMMARTVREPDSTCQTTRRSDLQLS